MASETESFDREIRRVRESKWRVNAIAREDIFLVRLDAIAMTNRNVTPTRKLLSRDQQPRSVSVHLAFCCGKTAAVESSSSAKKKKKAVGAADGWRSMSCTRRNVHPLLYLDTILSSPRELCYTSYTAPFDLISFSTCGDLSINGEARLRCICRGFKIHRYFPASCHYSENNYLSLFDQFQICIKIINVKKVL